MAIQTLPNTGRVGDGPRQRADGKWEVILNGQVIGTPYNTENEAQWYYETRAGLGRGDITIQTGERQIAPGPADNGDGVYPINGGRDGFRVVIGGQRRRDFVSGQYDEATQYYNANRSMASDEWQRAGGSLYGTTTYAASSSGDIEQMKRELRVAQYPGPWDDDSVRAAYARTVNSGSSGGSGSRDQINRDTADINRGLATSNQMDLDERKRQFDEMYKIELRKLGLSEQQIEQQTRQFWASFAGQLLQTATQLRGPGDWIKDAEFKSGGRDIFQALTGQTPIAAFGAPSGRSEPAGIMDLMNQLGIKFPQSVNLPSNWTNQITSWYNQYKSSHNGRAPSEQELKGVFKQITGFNDEIANKWYTQGVQWARQFGSGADQATQERWLGQWIPGLRISQGAATTPTTGSSGGAGGGGSAADNAYLDYIWSRRTDLENHYRSNGWDISTPEGKRAAVRNWLTYAGNAGKTAEQIARELGYSGQATGTAAAGVQSAGVASAGTGVQSLMNTPTPAAAQGVQGVQPLATQSAGTGAMGALGAQTNATGTIGAQTVTTPGQPAPSPGTGSIWQRLPQGWSMQIADWYKQEMARKGGVAPSANAVKAKFKEVTGYDDRMANKWYEMGTQYSRDYQRPADETQQIEWLKYWEPTFRATPPVYTPGTDRKSRAQKINGIWHWPNGARGMNPEPGKTYTQAFEPLTEQELRELGLQNDAGARPPVLDPNRSTQPAAPQRPTNVSEAVWNRLSNVSKQLLVSQGYLVPNPHRINPAVWDSYDPNYQQEVLALAEAGLSESGAWDRGQFVRQLNAARPKGNAPRRVTTNWGRLGSQFS